MAKTLPIYLNEDKTKFDYLPVYISFEQIVDIVQKLDVSKRATLSIVLDKPFYRGLKKRIKSIDKQIRNKEIIHLQDFKKELNV